MSWSEETPHRFTSRLKITGNRLKRESELHKPDFPDPRYVRLRLGGSANLGRLHENESPKPSVCRPYTKSLGNASLRLPNAICSQTRLTCEPTIADLGIGDSCQNVCELNLIWRGERSLKACYDVAANTCAQTRQLALRT
jgi:hypothetical protein